jgi:translocating chain-associated membrane protein 1
MGQESQLRRMGGTRKTKSSPPIVSQEFIIQNHGDIFSCIIVLVFAGFMFQATTSVATVFVAPQYNTTEFAADEITPIRVTFGSGIRDIATIVFYMMCAIVVHAVIQEYILDKLQRKLHLSKTKTSKFTESGHLAIFALYSIAHAVYIINLQGLIPDISQLWTGYPEQHREMSFWMKVFYLVQLAYWLHQFPEFYFQKVKKDDMKSRTVYSCLYIVFIGAAYALNFNRVCVAILLLHYVSEFVFHICRMAHFAEKPAFAQTGFKFWNILFVLTRLGCITTAFLTFWYGLRAHETPVVDFTTGNFNTTFVRLNCLLAVCGVQAYLMWNFIMYHLRQMRETGSQSRKANAHVQRAKQRKAERKERRDFEQEVSDLPEADQDHTRVLRSGDKKTKAQ